VILLLPKPSSSTAIGSPRETLPLTYGAVNFDSCPAASWKVNAASLTSSPRVRRTNFSQ
jgi:hypothetical protein